VAPSLRGLVAMDTVDGVPDEYIAAGFLVNLGNDG
jgi:hypothetical protein